MKIEPKMSGWTITEYSIDVSKLPFKEFPYLIYLDECLKLNNEKSMEYILENATFVKSSEGRWGSLFGNDGIMKIAILEFYPEYEAQLIEYFGEDWVNYYLRFNH